MTPRNYQLKAIEDIKASFKRGNKHICIALCGGAGKSLIAKMLLDMAAAKGSKIGFFSYRTLLIEQIQKYNIPNCTIGTLQKYGKTETELFDFVITDESWGDGSKLKNNIKSRFSVTLSGTPTDSYGNALDFDDIIDGVQTVDLIDMGFAKKLKILATPKVDTSKLKLQAGDFNPKDSYELMSKSSVIKDLVSVYNKYCTDRRVMLFGVNTHHCEELKKEFLSAGINCDTVHSKKKDTKEVLEKFDSGEINLLISVSMLNVGYDNNLVDCIIFARPTKSIPLMMQTIWRGTRLNGDKDCLVIDCCEVIDRCGHHPMERLRFNKVAKDTSKQCKCGLKMKISDRSIIPVNDFEYISRTDYKCECGLTDYVENLKLINLEVCAGCGETFKSNGIVLNKNDKGLSFDLTCICGESKPFRTIEYSNEELKEIELNEAFNGAKWDDVKVILRSECKKLGYKWQYSNRLIEHLQLRCTPFEAIEKIKTIIKQGKKISLLMYI